MDSQLKQPFQYLLYLRSKEDPSAAILQESLLHLALQRQEGKSPPLQLIQLCQQFIQRANIQVMASTGTLQFKLRTLSRALNLLMSRQAKRLLPQSMSRQLAVSTFSNLSTVYKQHGDLNSALASISLAVEIDQSSLEMDAARAKSIATTLLSKSLIESELYKHQEAAESLNRGIQLIDKYATEIAASSKQSYREVASLRMMTFYNLGCESLLMKDQSRGAEYLRQALRLARELKDGQTEVRVKMALRKVLGDKYE